MPVLERFSHFDPGHVINVVQIVLVVLAVGFLFSVWWVGLGLIVLVVVLRFALKRYRDETIWATIKWLFSQPETAVNRWHISLRGRASRLGDSRALWIPYSLLLGFVVSFVVIGITNPLGGQEKSLGRAIYLAHTSLLIVGTSFVWPGACLVLAAFQKPTGLGYGRRYLWWLGSAGWGWFKVTGGLLRRFAATFVISCVALLIMVVPFIAIMGMLFVNPVGFAWANQFGSGWVAGGVDFLIPFVLILTLLIVIAMVLFAATSASGALVVAPLGAIYLLVGSFTHEKGAWEGWSWLWHVMTLPDQAIQNAIPGLYMGDQNSTIPLPFGTVSVILVTLVFIVPALLFESWPSDDGSTRAARRQKRQAR